MVSGLYSSSFNNEDSSSSNKRQRLKGPENFPDTSVASSMKLSNSKLEKVILTSSNYSDRFIAARIPECAQTQYSQFLFQKDPQIKSTVYEQLLKSACFGNGVQDRILHFKEAFCKESDLPKFPEKLLFVKKREQIVNDYENDFYAHLLDVGQETKLVVLAVSKALQMFNEGRSSPHPVDLCFTAVKILNKGMHIAGGSFSGSIRVIDLIKEKTTYKAVERDHNKINNIIPFQESKITILAANRFGSVSFFDLRKKAPFYHFNIEEMLQGDKQITGLAESSSGNFLATGDDNNQVIIWDYRQPSQPLAVHQHKSSVRAIAWHPGTDFIATGGGKLDREVHIWDVNSKQTKMIEKMSGSIPDLIWLSSKRLIIAENNLNGTPFLYLKNVNLNTSQIISNSHVVLPLGQLPNPLSNRILSMVKCSSDTVTTFSANGKLAEWQIGNSKKAEKQTVRHPKLPTIR